MNAFRDLMWEFHTGDNTATATAIMKRLKLSTRQADVLREAVTAHIRMLLANESYRMTAVAVGVADDTTPERTAREALAKRNAKVPEPVLELPKEFALTHPQMRAMLPVEFAVDGRRVSWGRATINDFKTAIAERTRVATSMLVGVDQMKQAVRLLERSGAATLAELFARPAAA